MSKPEQYDAVVLGSGEAGKFIAWSLASQGKRSTVVERRYVGGSCPNIACLPSKNLIQSAKVANYFRRGVEFGIVPGEWKIEMPAVRARKQKMVDELIAVHQDRYRNNGAELIIGEGRFIGPRIIEVSSDSGTTRTLSSEMVVICTGSRAKVDPIEGLTEARPMTHVEALELNRIPEHLIVLGGGYVGLEMAQAFRRFGSRATVIERNDRLVHHEDDDVSAAIQELFDEDGIEVWTATRVDRVEGRSGASVNLSVRRNGSAETIEGSDLLIASGRTPNTENIGVKAAGIELDDRGFVKVNERLQTNVPGIWAVGDCAGSPQFTHIGYDDFRVVRDNLLGIDRTTTGRLVPRCLFIDPELARVGINESEAKSRGIAYRLAKLPVNSVRRAWTVSERRGFYKALVAVDSDQILGFIAFGPNAGEIMAIVQLAIAGGLPYTILRDSIMTHPTMAEGLVALFRSVPPRDPNLFPRLL